MSLFWLLEFVKNRKAELDNLSTQDVVNKIVIPETQQKKLRYADTIPDSFVSAPSYVVSHVWSAPFLDLVETLDQHFNAKAEATKSIYLWIDIFAINQHSKDKQSDLKVCNTAIKDSSSGTLVCIDAHGKLMTR